MDELFLIEYILINLIMACVSLYIARVSFVRGVKSGRYLCFTSLLSAWVIITYLVSTIVKTHFWVSVFSSLYFMGVDWLLVSLRRYVLEITGIRTKYVTKTIDVIVIVYMVIDNIVMLINPFKEIVLGYTFRDTYFAQYTYDKFFLYDMHLVFTYSMVAMVIALLLMKVAKTPNPYKSQYVYILVGVGIVVLINGAFLFAANDQLYSQLDYSTLLYSIVLALMYWSCFNYANHAMHRYLTKDIFDNIDQGIVLFDYEGHMVMSNSRARYLLRKELVNGSGYLTFLQDCNITVDAIQGKDSTSLQCFIERDDKIYPFRCDYSCILNKRNNPIGYLYVFTDAELDTDFMTGFQNYESFLRYVSSHAETFDAHAGVAVFDINNLGLLNSSYGKAYGDKKLCELADVIKQRFPKDAFLVRGRDAYLFAICNNTSENELDGFAKLVMTEYDGNMQYAVAMTEPGKVNVNDAMLKAAKAMKNKKLMDKDSAHSHSLTMLVRALRESDTDTEEHVKRTQLMGRELGLRIGLTDMEQSNLSLLCLLHDIGKIGIPLDILNKPGQLSKEEWHVLQSHVEKGYQIANSSNELSGIAEMILRHHERWDGQGYPGGLSRETIPLLSRIIAVVDAYDAMVNDRPYRKGMTVAEAISELKACAGSQFDPHIIVEFIETLKEHPEFAKGEQVANLAVDPERKSLYKCQRSGNAVVSSVQDDTTKEKGTTHPMHYSRYVLDHNEYIVDIDDRFELLTGYSRDDVLNLQLKQEDLIPESERTDYLLLVSELAAKNPTIYLEHQLLRKDGSTIYVFCAGKRYFDSAVNEQRAEIIVTDSSTTYSVKTLMEAENNRAKERLAHWEKTYRKDSLTGLSNHTSFQNDMEMNLLEQQSKFVLLMLDVDKFKNYNDTYGHTAGDEFLIHVAQALKGALRKDDLACRMGGDEFSAGLGFKRGQSDEEIMRRIQEIYNNISSAVNRIGGGSGISMGAAIAQPDETFISLYRRADQALYKSKENGRGRLSFADDLCK